MGEWARCRLTRCACCAHLAGRLGPCGQLGLPLSSGHSFTLTRSLLQVPAPFPPFLHPLADSRLRFELRECAACVDVSASGCRVGLVAQSCRRERSDSTPSARRRGRREEMDRRHTHTHTHADMQTEEMTDTRLGCAPSRTQARVPSFVHPPPTADTPQRPATPTATHQATTAIPAAAPICIQQYTQRVRRHRLFSRSRA